MFKRVLALFFVVCLTNTFFMIPALASESTDSVFSGVSWGDDNMRYLGQIFAVVMRIFCLPLNIFGYTVTFWQVFVYTVVAGILLEIIGQVFLDE